MKRYNRSKLKIRDRNEEAAEDEGSGEPTAMGRTQCMHTIIDEILKRERRKHKRW